MYIYIHGIYDYHIFVYTYMQQHSIVDSIILLLTLLGLSMVEQKSRSNGECETDLRNNTSNLLRFKSLQLGFGKTESKRLTFLLLCPGGSPFATPFFQLISKGSWRVMDCNDQQRRCSRWWRPWQSPVLLGRSKLQEFQWMDTMKEFVTYTAPLLGSPRPRICCLYHFSSTSMDSAMNFHPLLPGRWCFSKIFLWFYPWTWWNWSNLREHIFQIGPPTRPNNGG